jgi:ribonucleoside-diphosphate reductase alpha chain
MSDIALRIWDMKYRLKQPDGTPVDRDLADTVARVALAAAEAETPDTRKRWALEFAQALAGHKFLPAGRILAGAGTERSVTLFNCFVMGAIPDSMSGIFASLREAALTLQQGGGIGYDFSTLRPKGALVRGVGADASGPVSFMDVWDAMCRTIMSAGSRRGAMMATPFGARQRRIHGRGEERRALGSEVRRRDSSHGPGARPVGPHHARDL